MEGVPVVAPWLTSEVAKAATPQRRLTSMWVPVVISGGREETSHASSVFLSCFCLSLFSGGYCQGLPLLCHGTAQFLEVTWNTMLCGRRRRRTTAVKWLAGAARPQLCQRLRRQFRQLLSQHRHPHLHRRRRRRGQRRRLPQRRGRHPQRQGRRLPCRLPRRPQQDRWIHTIAQ